MSSDTRSILERIGEGIRDPVEEGAQTIQMLLPHQWVDFVNRWNNSIAAKTGLLGVIPPGGMDEYEARREQSIQALRGGGKSEDWWRDAGNMLSPANSIRLLSFIHSALTQGADTQQRIPGYPGWHFYAQTSDDQGGSQGR